MAGWDMCRVDGKFAGWLRSVARRVAGTRAVDTERARRRRELARSENQAGHNLTVQTTIDMARTQTWTGGA